MLWVSRYVHGCLHKFCFPHCKKKIVYHNFTIFILVHNEQLFITILLVTGGLNAFIHLSYHSKLCQLHCKYWKKNKGSFVALFAYQFNLVYTCLYQTWKWLLLLNKLNPVLKKQHRAVLKRQQTTLNDDWLQNKAKSQKQTYDGSFVSPFQFF